MSGGIAYFPRRAAPVDIDTDALPPEQREELATLTAAAQFFDRPAGAEPHAPIPDAFTYRLTIDDQGRRHTVVARDPIDDPQLAALIHRVRAIANERR